MIQNLNLHCYALVFASSCGYKILADGNIRSFTAKILKSRKLNGYKNFSVKVNGKSVRCMVHRLLAYKKYGNKMFEKGKEVRHVDGNKLNNSSANIAIGTRSQNIMDRPKKVRIDSSKKAASGAFEKLRKLTNRQVRGLAEDRKNGSTINELVEKYKISKTAVWCIIKGKTYKAIQRV